MNKFKTLGLGILISFFLTISSNADSIKIGTEGATLLGILKMLPET